MSKSTGGFLEIVMCWSEWLRVKNALQQKWGSLAPQQISGTNGCEAKAEIAWPHWGQMKDILDAQGVKYSYIDRSVENARWVTGHEECDPC